MVIPEAMAGLIILVTSPGRAGAPTAGTPKGFSAAGYSDGNGTVLITLVKSLN